MTVASSDDRLDVAANAEIAHDCHFPWVEKIHQIVEDPIRNIFVKDSLVTKLVQIKLEAFQFHAPIFRNVLDLNGGKVGETRGRTNAGEFRASEIYGVTAHSGPVRKTHEAGLANHPGPIGPQVRERDAR